MQLGYFLRVLIMKGNQIWKLFEKHQNAVNRMILIIKSTRTQLNQWYVLTIVLQMRPTTGPTRKDGVKQKHSVFRNSSQPPKVAFAISDISKLCPWNLRLVIWIVPGDVYKPRRPGDAGHRAVGAGRGDSAGLGQVSLPTRRHVAHLLTFRRTGR